MAAHRKKIIKQAGGKHLVQYEGDLFWVEVTK